MTDSVISNNIIGQNGGGILNSGGTVTITGSTISGNTVNGGSGGGIGNGGFPGFPGLLTITNSTISGNISGSAGGGIASASHGLSPPIGIVHLNNVTITNNTGAAANRGTGGGVSNRQRGLFTLQNTIIAGNRDFNDTAPDCAAGPPLTSRGYNLIQDTTDCPISGDTTGNITGQDPQLGLLLDHGGPTRTHALSAGSPARDAGNPAGCTDATGALVDSDQRGEPRPVDGNGDGTARCDIGAYESGKGFSLGGIQSDHAGNVGPVCVLIAGSGFVDGATVKLTRAGEADIVGTPVVAVEESMISTAFNLANKSPGRWDVMVTNPDGTSLTLPEGFTIDNGGNHRLWMEIIAPAVFRPGRPFRFFFIYGNRGNVDAVGVPIMIAVSPQGVKLTLRFPIAPPPPHPEQVFTDWSQAPITTDSTGEPDRTIVPLLLPVVPAGFTGVLEFFVEPPGGIRQEVVLVPDIGTPYFQPDGEVDPERLAELTDGALAYAQRVFGVDITAERAFTEQYMADQLKNIVGRGAAAWVSTGGRGSGGGGATAGGSSGVLAGPLSLALDTLSSNATLFSKTGQTSCATPVGPYKTVSVGTDNVLSAGESATVVFEFTNPSNTGITYSTRVLAGTP